MTWVKCGGGWRKMATISMSKMALMETPLWSALAGGGTWELFPFFWGEMLMWISKTRWGCDHSNAFPLGPVEAVDVICLLFAVLNINKIIFWPYFRETDTYWGHVIRLKSKIKHSSMSRYSSMSRHILWVLWQLCPCIYEKTKQNRNGSLICLQRASSFLFFLLLPPGFSLPFFFPARLPHYYKS